MPLLFFTGGEGRGGGGVGMKEKIKPLVQSSVRFMGPYTPPPDGVYIPMVGLIGESGVTPSRSALSSHVAVTIHSS